MSYASTVIADRIITDLTVMDVTPDGLALLETAPDVSADDVRAATEAPLRMLVGQ